mgnify:CR=1 FL=1
MPDDTLPTGAYDAFMMDLKKRLSGCGRVASSAVLCLVLSMVSLGVQAASATMKVCVFDPIGTSGDVHRALEDYRLQMARQGFNLAVRTYVDENVAVEDFRTGQCDGVMATGIRTRHFVSLAASLDSPGASSILRGGRIDMDASFDVVGNPESVPATPAIALMIGGLLLLAAQPASIKTANSGKRIFFSMFTFSIVMEFFNNQSGIAAMLFCEFAVAPS